MEKELKDKMDQKMEDAVASLKKDFGSIRTGRASLTLLDNISVDYYGTPTPVQQVASLSVADGNQILIQPWEQNLIPNIEKAILRSDLGLTPSNDGKVIRINIPQLTEERRKELVKIVRKRAEEARVSLRSIRRETNDKLKQLEKDKELGEDDARKAHTETQKSTDGFVTKVEDVLKHKEHEIMEV